MPSGEKSKKSQWQRKEEDHRMGKMWMGWPNGWRAEKRDAWKRLKYFNLKNYFILIFKIKYQKSPCTIWFELFATDCFTAIVLLFFGTSPSAFFFVDFVLDFWGFELLEDGFLYKLVVLAFNSNYRIQGVPFFRLHLWVRSHLCC